VTFRLGFYICTGRFPLNPLRADCHWCQIALDLE
jgi:hypothetical protein